MHRWSELFIPTLREAPADAEVASHKFLVRAGYVGQLAAGIYSYLFMGQIWYQIQTKFRDEPRPRSGLLRVRQFIMKDSYSFDIDAAGLDVSYKKHYDVYCRIFDRCGLKYMVVEAHSGAMGGSLSHEFMVRTPAGEDLIVSCEKCNYAANMEKATSQLEAVDDLKPEGDGKPLLVHTPGQKTIEDVARYLGVSPKNKIKTLALMANEVDGKSGKPKARPVILLMRGDHQMNEAKLSSAVGGLETRPMQEEEIVALFHSPAGFLGPIGIDWAKSLDDGDKPILIVDQALKGRRNLISGANKQDYH